MTQAVFQVLGHDGDSEVACLHQAMDHPGCCCRCCCSGGVILARSGSPQSSHHWSRCVSADNAGSLPPHRVVVTVAVTQRFLRGRRHWGGGLCLSWRWEHGDPLEVKAWREQLSSACDALCDSGLEASLEQPAAIRSESSLALHTSTVATPHSQQIQPNDAPVLDALVPDGPGLRMRSMLQST